MLSDSAAQMLVGPSPWVKNAFPPRNFFAHLGTPCAIFWGCCQVSPFELRVCNILRDELPDDPEIAVAYLDVDTYELTLTGLRKLQQKLVVGGVIVLDDAPATPKLAGALLALHEFVDEYEDQFVKMLWTGVYALLRVK